jgi:hypothetical protein
MHYPSDGGEVGIVVSSMDSGLEAFNRYPADDSFAALAFQPTADTKYLIQWFLSY